MPTREYYVWAGNRIEHSQGCRTNQNSADAVRDNRAGNFAAKKILLCGATTY